MPERVRPQNARLYFRIQALENMDWKYVKILKDRKTIYVRYRQELAKFDKGAASRPTYWRFCSDGVFHNDVQNEIYEKVMAGVLKHVIWGQDAIIMAYGQTGTGKSSSINGIQYSYEDRGILPRIATELFQLKSTLPMDTKMCIQISYIEVNRSHIKDLLKPYPKNVVSSVKDVLKLKARHEDEVIKSIFIGEARKEFSPNAKYLSHTGNSIFTFHITLKNKMSSDSHLIPSRIHIIDLAGADTVGNFSCLFKNPTEIGSGNLAKTQLEQFLLILCDGINEQIKVKQRINPIIQYLGSSFSNSTIMRFIGHIRTDYENLMVTLSILRFGQIIVGLKPAVEEIEKKKEDNTKKDQIEEKEQPLEFFLEKELGKRACSVSKMDDGLAARNMTQERYNFIQRMVEEYIQDKITHKVLVEMADMNIAVGLLKAICKQKEEEKLQEIERQKELLESASVTSRNKRSFSGNLKKTSKSTTTSKTSAMSGEGSLKGTKKSDQSLGNKKAPASVKDSKQQLGRTISKQKNLEKESTITKRTSSTSFRKSQTGRRKSSSDHSMLDNRSSLKLRSSARILPPLCEVPPEQGEAWKEYVMEKNDDYKNFLTQIKENETVTNSTYESYLQKVNELQEAILDLEKRKEELLHAKMTREYQFVENKDETGNVIPNDIEIVCQNHVDTAQSKKTDLQESVLRLQSELRQLLGISKSIKDEVKLQFDEYCRTKYFMPLPNFEIDENIEEALGLEEDTVNKIEKPSVTQKEMSEKQKFDSMKQWFEREMKKVNSQKMRSKKWIDLYK